MKRMPSYLSDCTERFPRVSSSTNAAFHASPCGWVYRAPIYKRVLFALMRFGWALVVPALLAAIGFAMVGCVDIDTDERTALAVSDLPAKAMAVQP